MIDAENAIKEWEGAFRSGTRREAMRRNEKLASYFDFLAASYQPSVALSSTAKLAVWLWEEEGLGHSDSVLDVGCGSGDAALALAENASFVTALDMSEGMLSFAQQRAKEAGRENIAFERAMWEAYEPKARHALCFSSMCPAVSTIEELLRFEGASSKICAIVTVGRGTNTNLRTDLRNYVASEPLPGLVAEGVYLFDLLYSIGRHPNVRQTRSHSVLRIPIEDAIDRYTLYYSCYGYDDAASRHRIRDFVKANSDGGIWTEKIDASYMMAYWRPPA
jgi:SAM-dependent methyltransferase